jgi:hypothetical protein
MGELRLGRFGVVGSMEEVAGVDVGAARGGLQGVGRIVGGAVRVMNLRSRSCSRWTIYSSVEIEVGQEDRDQVA